MTSKIDGVGANDGALESRGTAALVLVALAAYLGLSALCYYDPFVRLALAGRPVMATFAGLMVNVSWREGVCLIPWTRFPLILGTVYALATCASLLWRGRPNARLACFAAFFGLVAPQAVQLAVYLTTVHHVPVLRAAGGALLVVALPVIALGRPSMLRRFEAHEVGAGWASLAFGQRRILFTVVALAWLGSGAEVYAAWASFHESHVGSVVALTAMVLATVSAVGLLRLRVWALFTAVGAAIASGATAAMAFDEAARFCCAARLAEVTSAVLPLALVLASTWGFWMSIARRLRAE